MTKRFSSMTYTPEDFLTSTPPRRMMGSEMEYNVQGPSADSFDSAVIEYSGLRTAKVDPEYLVPEGYMLSNGARIYQEMMPRRLTEYATPECDDPIVLALKEHAGQQLLADTAAQATGITGVYKRSGYDHIAEIPDSAGYHENYLVPSQTAWSIKSGIAKHALASFIATRPVWAGAGIVGKGYRLSQRAHGVGSITGPNICAHGSKPMFMLNTRWTEADNWTRLELRSTDPNMSPWVTINKFAVTSLFLRLIEHRCIDRELVFADALHSMRVTSSDLTLEKPLRLLDDKTITAPEHQQLIAEKMLTFAKHTKVPKIEYDAAMQLYTTSDNLIRVAKGKTNFLELADTLDVAAKYEYLLRTLGGSRFITRTNAEAVARDLQWEEISSGRGARYWQRKKRLVPGFDTDSLRRQALVPPRTRAAARAAIINACSDHISYAGWASAVVDRDDLTYERYTFTDPSDPTPPTPVIRHWL